MFLRGAPNFPFKEWKRSETKGVEEYCWAITRKLAI